MAGHQSRKVAFHVSFSDYLVHGQQKDMTAKFDNVIMNIGDGYDPMTGIFTAPFSGTYVFNVKIQTVPGNDHVFNLFHNACKIGHVYADGGTDIYAMTSTMELAHVTEGDKVWVTSGQSLRHQYNKEFRGSDVTRFSGFLLYAD